MDFKLPSTKLIAFHASTSARFKNGPSNRFVLLAAVATAVFTGCAGETRLPVFPVTGKVQFQGKSPAGAIVVLNPVGATGNLDVLPTGTVKDDGSFTLTAYESDDGAPAGNYIATIQWYKVTKEAGGPGPNVLPKTYSSPKTSPVKVNVAGGPVQIPPIAIK
jgi:hypothetical protein